MNKFRLFSYFNRTFNFLELNIIDEIKDIHIYVSMWIFLRVFIKHGTGYEIKANRYFIV